MSQFLGSKTYVASDGSVPVLGVTDGSNAAAGYVGEYVSSLVTTVTNIPATGTWGDLTSITLTAGDWDISAAVEVVLSTGTGWGNTIATGISTTSGNTNTGLVYGDNAFQTFLVPTVSYDAAFTLPTIRRNITTDTTFYFKLSGIYTGGQPKYVCRIAARRIR